jgi:hypothetical protein
LRQSAVLFSALGEIAPPKADISTTLKLLASLKLTEHIAFSAIFV